MLRKRERKRERKRKRSYRESYRNLVKERRSAVGYDLRKTPDDPINHRWLKYWLKTSTLS